MESTSLAVGQWVKRRRRILDLTQSKLAQLLPCSVVTIQKLETDRRRPSREMAARLAECLEVPAEQRTAWVQFARAEAGSPDQRLWSQVFRPAANLPLPATSLVGRRKEVSAIKRLLKDDAHLVTLLGPPGIGKTRLALQVAVELRDDFCDGVCFVDLSAVSDAELFASAAAEALSALPEGSQTPRSHLVEFLHDKQLLLVLDNFEQIVSAAPLVAELVAASPWLRVLATSRVPLRVRGERQFPVPTLPVPDAARLPPLDSLWQFPSVALFAQRSREVRPEWRLTEANKAATATLVRRLDGLPLAIELIAARSKILSPQELLSRLTGTLLLHSDGLRDLPARQRTLHSAIIWSYDLLIAKEQALLRRLAVFAGGWTLEAAEAQALDGDSEHPGTFARDEVLDLLTSLVNHSLVQSLGSGAEPRFGLLETIRYFALDRLQASSEEKEARDRHVTYYVRLAESAEPHLTGAEALPWLECLQREHENLRSALSWTLERGDAESALRLSAALWRYWRKRGHAIEGLGWLQKALDLASSTAAPRARERADAAPGVPIPSDSTWLSLRARATLGAASLARTPGEYRLALRLHRESYDLFKALGDERGLAYVLFSLGADAYDLGDLDSAHSYYERSLAAYRRLGDARGTASLLQIFAQWEQDAGHLDRAEELFGEVLQIQQERGEDYLVAWARFNQGELARIRGWHERAYEHFQDALASFTRLEDHEAVACTLHRLGELAWQQADLVEARDCAEQSRLLAQKMGFRTEEAAALRLLGYVALAEGQAEAAAEFGQRSLAICETTGERLGRAQAVAVMGRVQLAQGKPVQAAELLQESLRGLEEMRRRIDVPDVMEALASAFAAQGQASRAAQLLAASAGLRKEMGVPVAPVLCGSLQRAQAPKHGRATQRQAQSLEGV
jgi:predicted ATPase/transcriptional regulator with XRE-family HTH domain